MHKKHGSLAIAQIDLESSAKLISQADAKLSSPLELNMGVTLLRMHGGHQDWGFRGTEQLLAIIS